MLRELLWWIHAKQQYDMQKENGFAGLIAILSVIFIVWQWDNIFYPIFNALGLVNIFHNAGLINENLTILSVINILATLWLLMVIIALITAFPMFFILLMLRVFGDNNRSKPSALQYAISIVLLPIALVFFVLYKLFEMIGLVSKGPKTLKKYVKEHQEMQDLIQQNPHLALNDGSKMALADLYAIQQTMKNDQITCTPLTYDEAVSLLNRAVPYLNGNRIYAFGYSKALNKWYLLLPNPIPAYASKAIELKLSADSPFDYKRQYKNYSFYLQHPKYKEHKPHFYTPATFVEFNWDAKKEVITLDLPEQLIAPFAPFEVFNATVVDIDELDYIVKLEGESIQFFYEKAVDNKGIRDLFDRAHAYAYIIPLAYPEEENYFTCEDNSVLSYYKELQRVPNAMELAFHFKEITHKQLEDFAKDNQWARDYLNEHHNTEQNN